MVTPNQKKSLEIIKESLSEEFQLPCRVDEMNDREFKLFCILSKYCADMVRIQRLLEEDEE